MGPFYYGADYRFNDKWDKEIGEYGFTMVPNALLIHLQELGLTPSEFLLLINIESYRWNNRKLPYPSVETLAKRTGLTTRTVTRLVTSLEKDRKVIKRIKRKGTSNQYTLEPLIKKLINLTKRHEKRVTVRHLSEFDTDISIHQPPTAISPKEDSLNEDIGIYGL